MGTLRGKVRIAYDFKHYGRGEKKGRVVDRGMRRDIQLILNWAKRGLERVESPGKLGGTI